MKWGMSLNLENNFLVADKNFGFWANHNPGHRIQAV